MCPLKMNLFDRLAFNTRNGGYSIEKYDAHVKELESATPGVTAMGFGPFGLFRVWIIAPVTEEGKRIKGVIVAHELDWVEGDRAYHQYSSGYEAIQEKIGVNLKFVYKEHSETVHRTLVRYDLEDNYKAGLLFTPATGEEIYFEIYGIDDTHGVLHIMWKGEA